MQVKKRGVGTFFFICVGETTWSWENFLKKTKKNSTLIREFRVHLNYLFGAPLTRAFFSEFFSGPSLDFNLQTIPSQVAFFRKLKRVTKKKNVIYGSFKFFVGSKKPLQFEQRSRYFRIKAATQKIQQQLKVIHLKYYKHLKKGHLGRQKMGWFLADQPVHQVKLKY